MKCVVCSVGDLNVVCCLGDQYEVCSVGYPYVVCSVQCAMSNVCFIVFSVQGVVCILQITQWSVNYLAITTYVANQRNRHYQYMQCEG